MKSPTTLWSLFFMCLLALTACQKELSPLAPRPGQIFEIHTMEYSKGYPNFSSYKCNNVSTDCKIQQIQLHEDEVATVIWNRNGTIEEERTTWTRREEDGQEYIQIELNLFWPYNFPELSIREVASGRQAWEFYFRETKRATDLFGGPLIYDFYTIVDMVVELVE